MKYLSILIFAIIGGCGAYKLVDPDDYDTKQKIYEQPVDYVTSRGWQIAVHDDFLNEYGIKKAERILHDEIDEFYRCMNNE